MDCHCALGSSSPTPVLYLDPHSQVIFKLENFFLLLHHLAVLQQLVLELVCLLKLLLFSATAAPGPLFAPFLQETCPSSDFSSILFTFSMGEEEKAIIIPLFTIIRFTLLQHDIAIVMVIKTLTSHSG